MHMHFGKNRVAFTLCGFYEDYSSHTFCLTSIYKHENSQNCSHKVMQFK